MTTRLLKPTLAGLFAVWSISAFAGPIENGGKTCKDGALKRMAWNDPEGVRVGAVSGGKMEVIDYADTRIAARRFLVPVNVKNAYGAYAGERPVTCFTSEDGMRILKMDGSAQ